PFDGVIPGMAFCYLGKGPNPPPGYFELDGMASWPDANWVPDALRGQKTQAAQGRLVGVATTATGVGTIWDTGVLQVPAAGAPESVTTSVLEGFDQSGDQGSRETPSDATTGRGGEKEMPTPTFRDSRMGERAMLRSMNEANARFWMTR